MKDNKIVDAYKNSQKMRPLFTEQGSESSSPLTFEDSLTPVPDHPICAFGVLSAKGERGKENSIAFVVEDNYLLTCASNCFSHKHGLSSNMTFTISSNRKPGSDTYKISKAFIPEQYKISIKSKRNEFNYALLYIEGDPKLKDKYGSIGIHFQEQEERTRTYLKLVTNNHGQLLSIDEFGLEQNVPVSMSGGALLQNSQGKKQAVGLVFVQAYNSPPCFMHFDKRMYAQLAQWLQVIKGHAQFTDVSRDELNGSYYKDEERKPIETVQVNKYNFEGKISSFFEGLPFTKVFQVILNNNQLSNDLTFLRQKKFRDLKSLSLENNNIGPQGCQIIASFFFLANLREICLNQNPILDEGCRHLSNAKWPFLGIIKLYGCSLTSKGLYFLMQRPWKNLYSFQVERNKFQKELSVVLQKVDLPRIEQLNLGNTAINGLDLTFIRSPSWKSLKYLTLNSNRIGNTGCKIIKQADLSLISLILTSCHIYSYGVKWLCKANLKNLCKLEINGSKMEHQAFIALSRTALPTLEIIEMNIHHHNYYRRTQLISFGIVDKHLARGIRIKWLFPTEWVPRVTKERVLKDLLNQIRREM